LGKIFDALEKSKKEHKRSATTCKDSYADVNEAPKKQDIPSDTGGSLYEYNNVDKNLVTLLKPRSFETEQFKKLRTNLLFPVSGKPPRTIMITSAVPGEGKSFVSANLAISIAQSINEHVLLMDCDIRKSCINSLFGFEDVDGLSDYLSNGHSVSSLLLKTKIKKLTIFPGGKRVHNAPELLSSDRMSRLLEEVKTRYEDRYIIIDSPPPHLTAETSAMARQVDGILLVVGFGSTRREMVSELIEIFGKDKIIGVVVNRFDSCLLSNYGYSKYGKYYGKYYGK
jgi:protein-tyrosine kinase